jgi:hypothetical protein
MRLYRFSPIKNKSTLMRAVKYIHINSHKLCKNTFGKYLEESGNLTIFSHYESEYKFLIKLRDKMTYKEGNINGKYYKLQNPIVINATSKTPKTTYKIIYIRKPDPYRSQVGNIDFFLEPKSYIKLKKQLLLGKGPKSARIFERADPDMIELYNPNSDTFAYVTTKKYK